MNFVTRLLVTLLRTYKRHASPLMVAHCRFVPSCSSFAEQAIVRHGLMRGLALALWRLARCHPLGGRGLDPVPDLPTSSRGN